MRLTKKNSQKKQNYYRHNKKSQRRHIKDGGHYEDMDVNNESMDDAASNSLEDFILKYEPVDGNSRNLHDKTEKEKELGSGQFGTVQRRCEKKTQSNCYAVKTLKIKGKVDNKVYKKLLEDLTREVEIQKKLTMNGEYKIGDKNYIAQYIAHSIKTAFDLNGKKKIEPYLAMKIYDKSLDSLNYEKDENFFTDNSIKKFIKQLCQGLKYMNDKNISHNDIAARNVLIAKVGEEYQPRITDFGLSQKVKKDPTEIIPNKYPILEGAPEINSGYMYKNSDVYSAAILLSNIIFNYHLFRYKGEDYEWKNLLKQAPFNKYPIPFNISNIQQMYRKIGNKEDNLTKGQPYVDIIINNRYLNEDYSNNSIIATIFEENTFRKAKCFRYDVTQRSNMDELYTLFNNKIPELNNDVFDYLKDESFVDGASPVPIEPKKPGFFGRLFRRKKTKKKAAGAKKAAEEEAKKAARPEADEEAQPEAEAQPTKAPAARPEAEAEAPAARPEPARQLRVIAPEPTHESLGGVLGEKAAAAKERAKAAQPKPPPIIQEPLSADPSNIAPKLVANVRERAAAEAEAEAAEARAAPEEKKTVANLITLMVNKKNHTKFPEIHKELQSIQSRLPEATPISKKKYEEYEKSSTGFLRRSKKRKKLLKKILRNLQEPNNNNSTAGGARTNKKKINKKYSKKSKKNYTINKKRTHKRK